MFTIESKNTWTDKREALLRTMWADGDSCSIIADAIGSITRNAVIGKVYRLGLQKRETKKNSYRNVGNRTHHRPRKEKLMAHKMEKRLRIGGLNWARETIVEKVDDALEHELIEIPVEQRKTLMQITDKTCHWPVGMPGQQDFFFCGGVTLDDKPYCAYHYRASIVPRSRPAGDFALAKWKTTARSGW